MEKAHESLLRERQIFVIPSSFRLWSSEVEIGWHWPMLVLGSVLLKDHTEICCFNFQLRMVADACQDQRRGCLSTSALLIFFSAREKPAPTVVPPC